MLENQSWSTFLSDYGVGILLILTSAAGSAFIGFFKGKKVSTNAVGRKNKIYQPLINELTPISTYDLDVFSTINVSFLQEIICNNYKYAISNELILKMESLSNSIEKYHNIDLIRVAHNILISLFEDGFNDLYGSTIEGTSYNEDEYGNSYETEHEVQELEMLKRFDLDNIIKSLLINENMPSYPFRLDDNNIDYTYEQVIDIYNSAFNVIINGERIHERSMLKEWSGTPSEYIAYFYDFFVAYNKDSRNLEKYRLREEIILQSQSIIQDLKDVVNKIVERFEKESL